MLFLKLIFILISIKNIPTIISDIADVRYASHVFEPGIIEPKIQLKREPSEEKNLETNPVIKDFVIEGDILVPLNRSKRDKRKIVNEINNQLNQPTRWPQKTIPYEFDANFPKDMISLFEKAVEHWHQFTCLKFEPFNPNKHGQHRSRLYVENSNICGSLIGYNFDKNKKLSKTNVYLGRVCSLGNIIHELGHAVGFHHEQSRKDRDTHIRINFNKLNRDFAPQYYVMANSQPNYYGIPYDLSSIMHYGSSNGIITALDPKRNFLMGQRKGLSFLDIEMANLAYKCNENCDKRIKCQNGGFLDQFCKCFCPDGTQGTYCEKILSDIDYRRSSININDMGKSLTCSFEQNNLCNWMNDKARSSQDWIFNRPELNGITETQHYFSKTKVKLGPQNGDRFGKKSSSYIYLNSVRKTRPNSSAILSSPPIAVNKPYPICLKFWYNMYHSSNVFGYSIKIGVLNVSIRLANGNSITIWEKNGNQGPDWKFQELDIMLKPPLSSINFEGYLDGVNYGDISIDEISIIKGKCKEELVFGDWSDWSNCSLGCGKGIKTRTRSCSYADGTTNFDICSKVNLEKRDCEEQDCVVKNLIHSTSKKKLSHFSSWSKWSPCTDGCFSFKKRYRTCINSHLGPCIGKKTEVSICSNCRIKKNILYKQLEKLFKNESKSEEYEDKLSEWSEWSSCYAMKNECDPGIQIRIKTCLSDRCKDEPKEVRMCESVPDADLKNFCSNLNKTLDIALDFKNEKIDEKSKLVKIFNPIDLSQSNRLKSFIIDINWLNVSDKINFSVHSKKNILSDKTYCFQMCLGHNLNEISILNMNSNKKFYQKTILDDKASYYYTELYKNDNKSNLSFEVTIEITKRIITEISEFTTPLFLKSAFIVEGECKSLDKEEKDSSNDMTIDINFSATDKISKIINTHVLAAYESNVARFRHSNFRSCGGVYDLSISKQMTISSPSYPYEYPSGSNCIYLIKSPIGTRIQIKVIDLDLQKTSLNLCLDSLELRYYHLGQPGPIFCGTFTHQNQLELISFENSAMIIFKSDWILAKNRRGFRLKTEYGYF